MFETVVEAADRLADAVRECDPPADDDALVAGLRAAIAARNAADGLLARLTGEIECRGTATRLGMSVRELLSRSGCVPVVASRAIRLGRAIAHLPAVARHLRDGSLSAEFADAVARGVRHVCTRTRSPLGSEVAVETEAVLIGHALAGRSPVEIADRARAIALEHEPEIDDHEPATPVAEDTTLNEVSWAQRDDGRLAGTFDLDVVTGERLISCVDTASRPKPLPDGTPDPRSAAQRRADAFVQVVEAASRRALGDGGLMAPARTEILLTVPVGGEVVPWRPPSLQWLGSVSDSAVSLLACDAAVTRIRLDGNAAPVDTSPSARLFTGRTRKAIVARDECCIKCGDPASWTDVHHIVFHSDGGPTTCDNGCLLCRTCHIAVHQHGWDIGMGPDRHPWIRPPATVDPRRELQPATTDGHSGSTRSRPENRPATAH
ncbi:MAG: DUF222 domain-containing protein [Gordonia paraffinivorans]